MKDLTHILQILLAAILFLGLFTWVSAEIVMLVPVEGEE